jgi:hypothetical protein
VSATTLYSPIINVLEIAHGKFERRDVSTVGLSLFRFSQWRLLFLSGPFVGNTSHPILLVGNTADPVTPLWKLVL